MSNSGPIWPFEDKGPVQGKGPAPAPSGRPGPRWGSRLPFFVMGAVLAVAAAIVVAGVVVGGAPVKTAGVAARPTGASSERSSTSRVSSTSSNTSDATRTTVHVASTASLPSAASGPNSTFAPSVTAGTAVPWSPMSSNTLVGGGEPANWPAARAKPPSLAGAYGTNMIRVFVTLMAYQDWVWSHPNPKLVANYTVPGTAAYRREISSITYIARRHWHTPPNPTEIDWVGVTEKPVPLEATVPSLSPSHVAYQSAALNCVLNRDGGVYLSSRGRVVGSWRGAGRVPFSVWLDESASGQWRVASVQQLNVPLSEIAK